MRREMRGARAEVQAGLEQYAAAGAHRFVIMMLDAALRPENYQAGAAAACVVIRVIGRCDSGTPDFLAAGRAEAR